MSCRDVPRNKPVSYSVQNMILACCIGSSCTYTHYWYTILPGKELNTTSNELSHLNSIHIIPSLRPTTSTSLCFQQCPPESLGSPTPGTSSSQNSTITWERTSKKPSHRPKQALRRCTRSSILENNEAVWQDELEIEQRLDRRSTGNTTSSASWTTSERS